MITLNGIEQVLWPDHCVQGSSGASFASRLDVARCTEVFRKGADPLIDSYSGFFDNDHATATGLEAFLKERGVRRVYVAGLATDYCVRFTALDALALGFETVLVEDACRAVNLSPSDGADAIAAIRDAGGTTVSARSLV
jgi:nicotinamidase/pyrazinamidase